MSILIKFSVRAGPKTPFSSGSARVVAFHPNGAVGEVDTLPYLELSVNQFYLEHEILMTSQHNIIFDFYQPLRD